MKRLFLSLIAVVIWTGWSSAANWPQWRGPSATGVAEPGKYPILFSDTENVVWKAALPAAASSTPAVWSDHIFVTCPIDGKDGVLCFDRAGNERWRVQFGSEVKGKHRAGSGSNPSPLTDGKRVFVYYKSGTIAALDFDGTVTWRDNLQERYGPNTLWWDLGTSPVLAGGNVVVAVIHTGDSFLVGLDPSTGSEVWREKRVFTCPRESDQSYTTPSVITVDGKERIVVWGADHLTGHDAATGKTLWVCEGFNPKQKGMWRTISSASVWDHIAVLSYGRGRNLCAIDLRDGLASAERWLWNKDDMGADVPTPATRDGKAYLLEDRGRIVCLDIKTGGELWASEAARGNGRYYASPILAGDRLYCVSEKGVVVVGQLGNRCATATANRMNEGVIATPVLVDDRLYVRGATHLFCFGE
jgi:outer membrane protein assembly factor BamB